MSRRRPAMRRKKYVAQDMTSTTAEQEKHEVRKRDYKHLLAKYKNSEEANDFFKLQLQDLNARLKLEQKDKERLHQELQRARSDICNKSHGHGVSPDADIEEVNTRLKEAYKKLDEEFELREQLNKDLEYTKAMLLAEGKVMKKM
jgi:predicted RNase H-like nuclease (RuvC/YqgF family)